MTAGLGFGIGCTPALSVTTAPLKRHMQQLWRDRPISAPYLYDLSFISAF